MNDTKEHIIVVACKLFLQKSFKEVTMKEIVQQTGLSKGAFYHYFESKEKLFLEVLDFFFSNIMVHRYESYSKESFYKFYHDYAQHSTSLTKAYIKKFIGDKNESDFSMNYITMVFDALKLFPEFREKLILELKHEIEIWSKVIKVAREKGEINSLMSDDEIAQTFIFLGDGIAMHKMMSGENFMYEMAPFITLWDKLYNQIKV